MPPPRGPSFAAAVWISRLFHPFAVPIPVLLAALRLSGDSWHAAISWTLVCVVVGIAPSLLLLVVERRRRGDGDWFVTVREQRRSLYLLGGGCLALLLAILLVAGGPRLLLAGLVGAIASNAIGAGLNRVTKVSVHAGASAGSAVFLAHQAPVAGAALGLATVAVAWARVHLAHHTPAQVLAGAGVAAGCVGLALRLLA